MRFSLCCAQQRVVPLLERTACTTDKSPPWEKRSRRWRHRVGGVALEAAGRTGGAVHIGRRRTRHLRPARSGLASASVSMRRLTVQYLHLHCGLGIATCIGLGIGLGIATCRPCPSPRLRYAQRRNRPLFLGRCVIDLVGDLESHLRRVALSMRYATQHHFLLNPICLVGCQGPAGLRFQLQSISLFAVNEQCSKKRTGTCHTFSTATWKCKPWIARAVLLEN